MNALLHTAVLLVTLVAAVGFPVTVLGGRQAAVFCVTLERCLLAKHFKKRRKRFFLVFAVGIAQPYLTC